MIIRARFVTLSAGCCMAAARKKATKAFATILTAVLADTSQSLAQSLKTFSLQNIFFFLSASARVAAAVVVEARASDRLQ